MKEEILKCDIEDLPHTGKVKTMQTIAIFDHDQEDGKSKTSEYMQTIKIEMCESCIQYQLKNRRYIYGYGAMGYNKYYLTN